MFLSSKGQPGDTVYLTLSDGQVFKHEIQDSRFMGFEIKITPVYKEKCPKCNGTGKIPLFNLNQQCECQSG